MALSNDLLSQFAKLTKNETKTTTPSYAFGEMVIDNGTRYVRLDGSELLTPVTSTVVANDGERVTVMLKNHTATVTGNLSSPAARSDTVSDLANSSLTVAELNTQVARIDSLEAARVNIVGSLNAHSASIETLQTDSLSVNGRLTAAEGNITALNASTITADEVRSTYATITDLNTANAAITNLQSTKIDATTVQSTYATITNLNTTNAAIETLRTSKIDATTVQATYATITSLATATAAISELQTNKLDATSIEGRFANIDFSNITEATMQLFFAASGLIDDVVINNATITGHLQGVTISGDLIDANTLKANRLLLLGSDGLYYKLNTDGIKVEAQQTDQNSLNGTVIKAKSITATKIDVTDLNAFGATIGGFKIGTTSLYSGTKSTISNTTRGIYLDTDGQIVFGDSNHFIKFFKDTGNVYKLNINADTITFGANSQTIETALSDVAKTATNFMSLSSNGLVIGDQTVTTLKGNILLKAETNGASISLRDGTDNLVTFLAANKTFTGITSAVTDSTDTNGRTQTVTSGQTFHTVQFNSIDPIYFQNGLKTDGVTINPGSIIANGDFTLNGTMFDRLGRSVVEGISGSQNLAIGYGRYKNSSSSDGTKTILYGNNVELRTAKGFTVMQDLKTVIQSGPNQSMLIGLSVYEEGTNSLMLYGGTSIDLVPKQTATINGVVNVWGALLPDDQGVYSLGNRNHGWSNIFLGQGVGENSQLRCIESDNSNTNICGITADGYLIFGTNVKENFYRAKNVSNTTTGLAFRIASGGESSTAVNNGTTFLYGGADSNGRYIGSHVAYSRSTTSAPNLFVGASGNIARSTSSSQRYKRDIVAAPLSDLSGLYNLPVKKFKYNNDYIYQDDELYDCCLYGFIAEDVEDILPCAVEHIDDGEGNMIPEMWNINIMVPAMMKLIQDLNTRFNGLTIGEISYNDLLDKPVSLPASDVYSWAKAVTKPSYTCAEVGAAPSDHSHNNASANESGMMSAADKTKLDSIAEGAQVNPISLKNPHALTLNGQNYDGSVEVNFGAFSNPNLLDNWDFRKPINQRGNSRYPASGYSTGVQYTIDRWRINSGCVVTVKNGSINFTTNPELTSYTRIQQPFEVSLRRGETYTFTMKVNVRVLSGNVYVRLSESTGNVILGTVATKITQTGEQTLTWTATIGDIQPGLAEILVGNTANDYIDVDIYGAKLERGAVSTLVNDPPPNPATELIKCQRYFYNPSYLATGGAYTGIIRSGTGGLVVEITLPTVMRIQPTAYSTQIEAFDDTGVWKTLTATASYKVGCVHIMEYSTAGATFTNQYNYLVRYLPMLSADL